MGEDSKQLEWWWWSLFPLFEASPLVFEFLKAKDNSQRVIVKDITCHYFESLLCSGFDSLRIGLTFLTFLTFNLEAGGNQWGVNL